MNILFFRFYILFILIFLLIVSVFISKQLLMFIYNNLNLNYLRYRLNKNNILNINYVNLFDCYLFNGEFFVCISLCEFLLELNKEIKNDIIYTSLAYIYKSKFFYSIAEYYYFKSLSLSNINYDILFSLSKMYTSIGYQNKADQMLNRISSIDTDKN